MIKKIIFTLLLLGGFSSNIHADMPAQIPDMNAQMAKMQKGMAMLPFLTAPIENSDKLSAKDVEPFPSTIQNKDKHYADYSVNIGKGYEKAAAVLKKGVS